MKNNPLLDKDFLYQLDQCRSKKIYAKIISLTLDELPIEEITGRVTGGSINIDGTSAVRRTCSVSLVAEDVKINDYYWGINTKFQLFIGVENTVDEKYENIIWFKQGIFLITSFNTSLQLNTYNISIQGKDKMCLINGDIGGTIESLTADFGKYEQVDSKGNIIKKDYLLKEIITEAVHHYAKEPYSNIIVKDLDMTGLELLEYRGDKDLYLLIKDDVVTGYRFQDDPNNSNYYMEDSKNLGHRIQVNIENLPFYDERISMTFGEGTNSPTKIYTAESDTTDAWTVARIQFGDTCGYRETELTYVDDLIANVGESIGKAVLDKIVSMLGNYEYFYDIDGHFVFQEKPNYINNSWNSIQKNEGELYVENAAYTSPIVYSFLDSNLITSFQNTPNLSNLKNDYSIWGTKKSGDNEIPIHLRYAIDSKPVYYKNFNGDIYLTNDEYNRLKLLDQLEKNNKEIIINFSKSRFKITPLPKGLSDDWWEIDDWTRRYLYFADVDENRGMTIEDYIHLTNEEVYNIVHPIVSLPASSINTNTHDFTYYVYQLKQQLGVFSTRWATEDWLDIFPQPSNGGSFYYSSINNAANRDQAYWAWLIDTDFSEETGKEYIASVEHGSAITDNKDTYPSKATGCTHSFDFALFRKREYGQQYHVYIYYPEIPPSVKNNAEFIEKEDENDPSIIEKSKYYICDWREIIYQMASDYFHYQHNDNFTVTIAQNNKNYYPEGFTKYEQYYTDIYGFWRDIYNPFASGINSHVVDISKQYLYLWDNEDFTELSLDSEENVVISKPQDVVQEDGDFYYVSGKDKYTPYIVSTSTQEYYLSKLYKDLSSIRYDPSKVYVQKQGTSTAICTNIGYKKVFLTPSSYRSGYYYTKNDSDISVDPVFDSEYIPVTFENGLNYVPNKYYYLDKNEYKLDQSKTQRNNITYYTQNSFNENTNYFEKSIYFEIGYKYYSGEEWQKVNNFAAGIQYYTQNYYQPVSNNGNYNKNDNGFFVKANNGHYKKVTRAEDNVEIGYEQEIYVDPQYEYYELLTTQSMVIYAKVTAFMRGKRYYRKDSNTNEYFYDDNVIFETGKTYYTKVDDTKNEIIDLTDGKLTDYYYFRTDGQGLISDSTVIDKNNCVIKGNVMKFYPGDIYYCYEKQDYNNMDNGYYFLKGQYYYLSTSAAFNQSAIYYTDIYSTVAAITREQYLANKYYLKGANDQKMFTKYNILHRFKKGYEYYIIENEDNKSLISEKNYLLATFYPKSTTIFYYLYGNTFIPTSLTQEVFNSHDKDYYIAYGKYNYYCYTDNILQYLYYYKDNYDPKGIYYYNDSNKTFKQNYIGLLTEEEWKNPEHNDSYYLLGSEIQFQKTSEYNASKTYYRLPDLKEKLNITTEDQWSEDYYELIHEKGIYLSNEFDIQTHWSIKTKNPESLIFWFDFMDISTGGELAQYSAHLIGNRPKAINDKDVKSIYYRDIPTVIFKDNNNAYIKVFINEEIFKAGEKDYYIYDDINERFCQVKDFSTSKSPHYIIVNGELKEIDSGIYLNTENMYDENEILIQNFSPNKDYYRKWEHDKDNKTGYTYVNITDNLNNLFTVSTQKKSTFNKLDEFLYNFSYCTETVTLNSIPIYYLEPNNRILIRDDKTGINGEYLIQKISLPLTYNGIMNINATKAISRIY